jgi:hypothetical protein
MLSFCSFEVRNFSARYNIDPWVVKDFTFLIILEVPALFSKMKIVVVFKKYQWHLKKKIC